MTQDLLCTFEKNGTCNYTDKVPTVKVSALAVATKVITWSITGYSRDIAETRKQERAIKRAFFRIGLVIPVKFKFIRSDPNAEIVISFSQTDPYFVEHSSALAYAYVGTTHMPVDLVFNDKGYFWAINTDAGNNQYKIEPVAIHEILHVLGLGHNPGCNKCIMFPSYHGGQRLEDEDVTNIQNIWGERSNFAQLRQWLYGYLNRLL